MSTLLVGAALLALLVAAMLLWRRDATPRSADLDDPNLQWYRQRRAELAGDDATLLEDAQLRLLEEGTAGQPIPPATSVASAETRLPWLLLGLLLLGAALLYLRLGAFQDVLIYRQLENLDGEDPAALVRLRDRIAARSADRPDNLQYLDLLGQLHLSLQEYEAAAATYARLAELAPQDPQVQAQAAQARFLSLDRVLDERAQLLAERALALDPGQQTALGLLGMGAFERSQYAAAVTYWERLQALETPGSPAYTMLEDVIGVARERAGTALADLPAAPAGEAQGSDGGDAGITVNLSLPAGVEVGASATIFVFARSPGAASRMPIAVRRLSAGELPLSLRLSDADSMAGQRLSGAGEVVVSAQLSRNGQPGEANAAYIARSEALAASSSTAPVDLVLQPVEG